jgi:YD repeat-containing protein
MCASGGTASGPLLPTGGSGGNISYTPLNPTASLRQEGSSSNGEAKVDPSTGALVYDRTDLSIGSGGFPAALAVNRSFNSRYIRNNGRPAYRAGGAKWYAFGYGSTHNLDVRFDTSEIFFGTDRYTIVTIHIGFQSITFQRCTTGFVNMKRDGSRLFSDSTFPNGYRYETKDGDKLYFQGMPQSSHGGTYYCNGSTWSAPVCGYLKRWIAPNGEQANFSYEEYYSHPTNATSPGGYQTYAMTGFGTSQQCHTTTKGVQDCRDINQPWYVMRTGQTYATSSYPINDFRLKEVVNSRGYRFTFDYLDNTVNVQYSCGGIGSAYTCGVYNNEGMERNRVSSVAAWAWTGQQYQQLSSVQYGYVEPSGYNGNFLRKITGTDGSITRIEGIFDLYQPGQSIASVKPTWANMEDGYYYPHTDEVHSTADYYVRTTYYPGVITLKRGEDAPTQYTATIAGRWLPDAYGQWRWESFVSRMQIADGVGTTTYDYLDDNLDDHYGPSKTTNALNHAAKYAYNALGTPVSETSPEGIKVSFSYDVRGNLLSRRTDPKPGSAGQPITIRAGYVGGESLTAEQCPNQLTCNKMSWSEDALGQRSDYEWDATMGGIRRTLGPVLSDGSRSETTLDYASFTGMSGQVFSQPNDLATRISLSEWKHDLFEYGSDVRHLPIGVVQSSGGINLRKCARRDPIGNVIEVTEPRAGLTVCP